MTTINAVFPNTNVAVLNKVAKEYIELRIHEFNHVIMQIEDKEKCLFYNEYQFHQYHNLSSLNLIFCYRYKKNKIIKECVSFHVLNDLFITIDDLVFLDDIKLLIDCNLDYNNFYMSKEGLNFIYIVDNQEKEKLIKHKHINYKKIIEKE